MQRVWTRPVDFFLFFPLIKDPHAITNCFYNSHLGVGVGEASFLFSCMDLYEIIGGIPGFPVA